MHIVFLGSRLPLTKTFSSRGGAITAAPYPHVTRVTSFHEQASTLDDLYRLLLKHAADGHCLFNGQLDAPLVDESRAGHTAKADKQWIVFDFDKVEGKDAADVIKRYLPAYCQQVSFIAQLSATMFRPDTTLWSGHIFMLLKQTIEEQQLRYWFEHLNFTQPNLFASMRLSDSLQALHWPLDRTVAYNSKLIYIAPPKCHGFTPAVEQHISLVKRKQSHLVIPPFTPIDHAMVRQKINELRRAIKEPEIDYEVIVLDDTDVLRKTQLCEVHDLRTSGDHYIRFNLNGGDSYAYFIDLRNPSLIRNFKGEPALRTQDAAPDLFKSLCKTKARVLSKPALDDDAEVLAFYATNRASQIKIGVYKPTERSLRIEDSSLVPAMSWLAEYGLVLKGNLPHKDIVFDPKSDVQYHHGSLVLNTFKATSYMARERKVTTPTTLGSLDNMPVINRMVRHMMGNPNDALVAHFINWLAYVYQYREKTGTAWVMHGRTGTGKSSFVKYVLTPIFGPEHVRIMLFGSIMSEFNSYLENALFVVYEEADTTSVNNEAALMTKLKHYITDSPIEMNGKNVKTYQAPSYTNFIFNSNTNTPVKRTADDRRFNIAEHQTEQVFFTPNELQVLIAGDELDLFADLLQRWTVDVLAVTKIADTAASRDVLEATTSINQQIADAIKSGNLQFFIDRTPSQIQASADFHTRFNPIGLFEAMISRFVEAANKHPVIMTDDEVFFLFRTLIPDTRYFQDSKTWRLKHYKSLGLNINSVDQNTGERGIQVKWMLHKPWTPEKTNVTHIAKRKTK